MVLTCVGGKDSYAVFEAAKDDAAAVLFVGKRGAIHIVEEYFGS